MWKNLGNNRVNKNKTRNVCSCKPSVYSGVKMTKTECNKIRDILIGADENSPRCTWPVMTVFHVLLNMEELIKCPEDYAGLQQAKETIGALIRIVNNLKEGG